MWTVGMQLPETIKNNEISEKKSCQKKIDLSTLQHKYFMIKIYRLINKKKYKYEFLFLLYTNKEKQQQNVREKNN